MTQRKLNSPEPCLCGALDCPRCFPASWKENILYDLYLDLDTGQSYDDWLEERSNNNNEF